MTTKIDNEIFKPLFPEGNKRGCPNAFIRILVVMSVLKEVFGCSDENLFEKCEFDLLIRKALGMELLTDVAPSIPIVCFAAASANLGKNRYRSYVALLCAVCWQSGTPSQDIM